ncbi:T6SS immunity protein Tli4 family protein [Paraburkholderia sp. BL25I1N1]|uniref:T6SS immunity protein Tli4 family protein n=1 Tax=Paraburkholderia sp. BL25I1N1 TaxID=1938804 RepID=UPI0011B27410|nr:T6SS immunity protein Tli4 family protein [Paraburkholderia sp. BL25I1N1]
MIATVLMVGCGPSRAERQAQKDERIWSEDLASVSKAAYTTPVSSSERECLGRHAFNVAGRVEWPSDPGNSYMFSPRQSASIYDVHDGIEVGSTRVAVVSDPKREEFNWQFKKLDLDRKNSINWNTKDIATWTDWLARTTSDEERKSLEERIHNDELSMARARLDHRFETGIPDSLGVWESEYPDELRADDDRRNNRHQTLTAYVYRKPWLHIFEQTGPAGQPQANEARMREFLQRFRARAEFEIPTQQGLCIPYGFIADDGKTPFRMKLGMRYRDVPGVIYVIDTGVLNDQTPPGGGALWDALGVSGVGLLGAAVPENVKIVERIGPKKVRINGRGGIESGVVARVEGLSESEKDDANHRADYTPAQLKKVLNRPPYEVYTVYAGTNAKPDSQALPWLAVKMRTFARNQVEEGELASDPPPFAQSQPRFEGLLNSIGLRATTPALPEVAALGKGYGETSQPLASKPE